MTEMIESLVTMRQAGLADYGRYPTTVDQIASMASVYCMAIEDKGGIRAFIGPATRLAIRSSKDFPSAPDFADLVLRAMAQATTTTGLTVIDPKGRVVVEILTIPITATEEQISRMKESRLRQLRSIGYSQPALPAPEKQAPATRDQILELRRRLGERSSLARLIDQQSL